VLPPFDKKWLDTWTGMTAPKLERWEKERLKAEKKLQDGKVRSRL